MILDKNINQNTIWNSRQNNPELVVQDCITEFNLTETDADKLRFILMNRGINKWLLARRQFIKLKHQVKNMMKDAEGTDSFVELQYINEKMQNIAKMPRWVVWPTTTSRNWKNIERDIVILGRKC